MAFLLKVNAQESGLKLIAFLRRCLLNEDAEFYRWIRTGQVRINSGRAKSSSRVYEGDSVRVPPFAKNILCIEESTLENVDIKNKDQYNFEKQKQDRNVCPTKLSINSYNRKMIEKKEFVPIIYTDKTNNITIPVVYENEHILVINKPAGLASQGGTGQNISLVAILKSVYNKARFVPAPVHRLDKSTSGLLCIGKSYTSLRFLSDFFQEECYDFNKADINKQVCIEEKKVHKEYLAWVHTKKLEVNMPFLMEHYVYFDANKGRMCAQKIQQGISQKKIFDKNLKAKYVLSRAVCLSKRGEYSLIKVGIFTGRKHQIRVQCEALGFPILGENKYTADLQENNRESSIEKELKLHAYRLVLPENKNLYQENIFEVFPSWEKEFCVTDSL